MGADISKEELQQLLKDEKLISTIVKKVIADEETLSELAGNIAEELASAMGDDPAIKKQIMKAALASPGFKQKIIRQLVNELGDD